MCIHSLPLQSSSRAYSCPPTVVSISTCSLEDPVGTYLTLMAHFRKRALFGHQVERFALQIFSEDLLQVSIPPPLCRLQGTFPQFAKTLVRLNFYM